MVKIKKGDKIYLIKLKKMTSVTYIKKITLNDKSFKLLYETDIKEYHVTGYYREEFLTLSEYRNLSINSILKDV